MIKQYDLPSDVKETLLSPKTLTLKNIELIDTDSLVLFITSKVGVPLPVMDYSLHKKYITKLPINISIGDCVTGIEKQDTHDTFRDGCISIIKWHIKEFGNS